MADDNSQPRQKIDPSLFNMWRCVSAVAHADGLVQDEERAYLEKVFDALEKTYDLTPDEVAVLRGDLDHAPDIGALLPLVTKPENRGMIAHFSRILAWADGELDMAEEMELEKLGKLLGKDIDAPELQEHIRAELKKTDAEMEAELKAAHADIRKQGPLSRALDAVLLKMGIDMLG